MSTKDSQQNGDEAGLWAMALTFSVLVNGVILAWVSYEVITAEMAREKRSPKANPSAQVVIISPEMLKVEKADPKPVIEKPKSVRTSKDQEIDDPTKSRRYIGERNTRATSDSAPSENFPAMPSQAGREPRPEDEVETTESRYQDGKLNSESQTSSAVPSPPSKKTEATSLVPAQERLKGMANPNPGEAELSQTAVREKLLEGPNPVETQAPKAELKENIKPREEKKIREGQPDGLTIKKPSEKPKEATKPTNASVNDPAFSGNQSKTAIRGSISRTGRSALDVVDTPMGRYHAKISRAVELEWQRNCVKRRDFIVPGYLTARFFLDSEGRVKTVDFMGDIEGGAIQKGFTLDSIREAPIPPMPAEVKKEMGGEALELIFNFYF